MIAEYNEEKQSKSNYISGVPFLKMTVNLLLAEWLKNEWLERLSKMLDDCQNSQIKQEKKLFEFTSSQQYYSLFSNYFIIFLLFFVFLKLIYKKIKTISRLVNCWKNLLYIFWSPYLGKPMIISTFAAINFMWLGKLGEKFK